MANKNKDSQIFLGEEIEMKPNIFKLATTELSQDCFFTWLLQWADNEYSKYNRDLNETAKDFVRLLLNKPNNFNVNKVEAGRQWYNIDIWAEVNDEFFIGIEDKTNSGEHSEQLERYKEIASNHYKDKKHKLFFVYLKTGNESLATLNKVREKGYSVINREAVLHVLNKRPVSNEIFDDFKDYLIEIDDQTNSFNVLNNITSSWRAGEGFYSQLQEFICEWSNWGYVPNQRGGFLGFWYHWTGTDEIGDIYIQIENAFELGIKVVIKIADWEQNTKTLYRVLKEIKPFAEKNGIAITKPARYSTGETSTLAIVQNAFQSDKDGNFFFEDFLKTLKKLEKTLDEYCNEKNTAFNSS